MTKLVCRFLDANNELLGWTEVQGQIPGDGKLWCQSLSFVPSRDGFCATLSTHWCDLNVEIRVPFGGPVSAGIPVVVSAGPFALITVGPMATGLPPVTVGSVAVGVPVGSLLNAAAFGKEG